MSVDRIVVQPPLIVAPETPASDLLEQLDDATDIVPVLADGEIVGVVRPHEIGRYAQLHRELRAVPQRPLGAERKYV